MRHPTSRHAPRFAVALVALAVAIVAPAACGFFGPHDVAIWVCDNPVTGKLDNSIYDANHYVAGVFDPCHCYDPCGPSPTCPITVDAGPPVLGCDAGDDVGDAGDAGP